MAAKTLFSNVVKDVPYKPIALLDEGRTCQETSDPELDDEVERELREFERLQEDLQKTGHDEESEEELESKQKNTECEEKVLWRGGRTDLNNLEHERITVRQKISLKPHEPRKTSKEASGRVFNVPIQPDTLSKHQMDVEESFKMPGIPEDGEQPCLDISQLKRFREMSVTDPFPMILSPQLPVNQKPVRVSQHPDKTVLQGTSSPQKLEYNQRMPKSHETKLIRHEDPTEARLVTSARKKTIMQTQDPRIVLQSSPERFKDPALTGPIHKIASRNKQMASREWDHLQLQPPSPKKKKFTYERQLVPKKGVWEPLLQNPSLLFNEESCVEDLFSSASSLEPTNELNEMNLQLVRLQRPEGQPGRNAGKPNSSGSTPVQRVPSLSTSILESENTTNLGVLVPKTSTSALLKRQETNDTQKIEDYCVIELILMKRFKNCFHTQTEKLDIVGQGRPGIWSPELYPFVAIYEDYKWLAACNEFETFFCWPCLLFAKKGVWMTACEEQFVSKITKEVLRHSQSLAHRESAVEFDSCLSQIRSSIIKKIVTDKLEGRVRREQDVKELIRRGRPQPAWDKEDNRRIRKEIKATFEELYKRVKWLCGCVETKQFYCWPCLLFRKTSWCKSNLGTINPSDFLIRQHEVEQSHMEACFQLGEREFNLTKESAVECKENDSTDNFLQKFLVELFCAEMKKTNNSESSWSQYVGTLDLMSGYNRKLWAVMEEKKGTSFTPIVESHMNVIKESVEGCIKEEILREIKRSSFVCLIVDHASGLTSQSILSIIARYVDNEGKIYERFVKLLNFGYNTPLNTIRYEFYQSIIELQCRISLVGFTYDGYFLPPNEIPVFNARVRKLCPNAKFFHYSEHNFIRIIQQTLTRLPYCGRIFSVSKKVQEFFKHTPKAQQLFMNVYRKADEAANESLWTSVNFVKTMYISHAVIEEIMGTICRESTQWNVSTVSQAAKFADFFENPQNRFFITLIARVYTATSELTKALEDEVDFEELKRITTVALSTLHKLSKTFANVVEAACSHLEDQEISLFRREILRQEQIQEDFSKVISLTVELIKSRISEMESEYFHIEKPSSRSVTTKHRVRLKSEALLLVNTAVTPDFDSARLTEELQFFRDFPFFQRLTLVEIIATLRDYNMIQTLPELFKFLQLALTVPKKLCDALTTPAVRRITLYLEGKKHVNSSEALFWMEKESLTNLQKGSHFYDVITKCVLVITKDSTR